nr:uncharacterized protein LOC127320776 [Lolium perenne]
MAHLCHGPAGASNGSLPHAVVHHGHRDTDGAGSSLHATTALRHPEIRRPPHNLRAEAKPATSNPPPPPRGRRHGMPAPASPKVRVGPDQPPPGLDRPWPHQPADTRAPSEACSEPPQELLRSPRHPGHVRACGPAAPHPSRHHRRRSPGPAPGIPRRREPPGPAVDAPAAAVARLRPPAPRAGPAGRIRLGRARPPQPAPSAHRRARRTPPRPHHAAEPAERRRARKTPPHPPPSELLLAGGCGRGRSAPPPPSLGRARLCRGPLRRRRENSPGKNFPIATPLWSAPSSCISPPTPATVRCSLCSKIPDEFVSHVVFVRLPTRTRRDSVTAAC